MQESWGDGKMHDKLIYIPDDDRQNYPYCRLKSLKGRVEKQAGQKRQDYLVWQTNGQTIITEKLHFKIMKKPF